MIEGKILRKGPDGDTLVPPEIGMMLCRREDCRKEGSARYVVKDVNAEKNIMLLRRCRRLQTGPVQPQRSPCHWEPITPDWINYQH